MEISSTGPRLIIVSVCRIPVRRHVPSSLKRGCARFAFLRTNGWMLFRLTFTTKRCVKIEALQWKLGKELLALGLTVIVGERAGALCYK
jgi:hypothetical protein